MHSHRRPRAPAWVDIIAATALVSAVVGVPACSCGEPLEVLTAKIAIADPVNPAASVCTAGDDDLKYRDCAFDFGDVAAGGGAVFSFTIENRGRAAMSVPRIAIVGSPRFTLESADAVAPLFVEAGAGATVTVRYSPEAATAETADVVVSADAANLDAGEDVVIHLKARGEDAGAPALVVNPSACDFGAVGLGVRASCVVSLQNTGAVELDVTALALSASSPAVFSLDETPALPLAIGPGTAVSVSVSATPASLDPQSGTLVVESNDPARPSVDVPLTVSGAEAPTAVARVARINGAPNTSPSPAVEPLDDVVLSADQSTGFGGATIAAYQWSIIERPAESSVALSAPEQVETGFVFSSAAGDVAGVDVAGTFRVRLVVTDSSGAISANDAVVTLNAVPTEGLHVQLSWSVDSNDLDLHLGRDIPVQWCGHDDCYYGNCEGGGLNWDGVAGGQTAGDPSLDIDDLRGFGPENISVDQPADGSYVVAVHAYDGNGDGPGFTPTDVTVKIFVGGALAGELLTHFDARNQFWRAARLDVAGGVVTITPIDTVQDAPADCAS